MKSIIVGTAGHIDHGKTALVKALTGIDADRLEEEKRRGITIDLGFAHMELAGTDGEMIQIGFVDVPGHERFVRNMLAGVGGIDGQGVGGGLYITTGGIACADAATVISGNHATTSNDDVFGTLGSC